MGLHPCNSQNLIDNPVDSVPVLCDGTALTKGFRISEETSSSPLLLPLVTHQAHREQSVEQD